MNLIPPQPAAGMEPQRLDKLVAAAGKGSRREVRNWIRSGRVRVDGKVATDPGLPVIPATTRIELDGERVHVGPLVIMLHKPSGLITATVDPRQPTVNDLFPPAMARRLFPAGRLDKDTEGLLILTDDGKLCHRLISPRHGVEKEYLAQVDGPLPPDLPAIFAEGIRLRDGYVTRPARLEPMAAGPPGKARVVVTEGKYHQVRRMFAACGLTVLALRRVRIGSLTLDGSLAPGQFRALQPVEVAKLLVNPPA